MPYSEVALTLKPSFAFDIDTNKGLFLTGQVIQAGVPVGRITASGKLIPSISDASDGSQNPIGVTAFAIDTSATGTNSDYEYSYIVRAGLLDFSVLPAIVSATTGTGAQKWTLATLRTAFETRNISVKSTLKVQEL